MLAIEVRGSVKEHIKGLNRLQRRVIKPAVNSSLNKTATKTRTFIAKSISKETRIVQKKIRPHLRLVRSSFKKLRAGVIVHDTGQSLYKWTGGADPTRRELAAAIAPTPVTGQYFKASVGKGRHMGFFKRQPGKRINRTKVSKGGYRYKSSKLSELYINPVGKAYRSGRLKKQVDEFMEREFGVVLVRELRWRANRLK